jgi:hypothetical protein
MAIAENSVPSSDYAVNVRCVQVIQVCHCPPSQLVNRNSSTRKAEPAPLVHRYRGTLTLTGNFLGSCGQLTCPCFRWLGNCSAENHARAVGHRRGQTEQQREMVRPFVSLSPFSLRKLPNDYASVLMIISRLRTYTFVPFNSECEVARKL